MGGFSTGQVALLMNDIESLAPPGAPSLIRGVLFRDPSPPPELVALLAHVPSLLVEEPSAVAAPLGVARCDLFDARDGASGRALRGIAFTISGQV
jgi:hypothetical protein